MTQPTNAQRLADALEQGTYLLSVERDATAAELLKLEAENAQLRADLERKSDAIQRLWAERDDLRKERHQLRAQVEALSAARPMTDEPQNDPLYEKAVALVRANGRASISLLQLHFKTGYNRTARLLERMVCEKIIEIDPDGTSRITDTGAA